MTYKLIAQLEWKNTWRKDNITQRILFGLGKGYFALCYLVIMVAITGGLFELPEEFHLEPLAGFFKFAIYICIGDLVVRYFFQKMPTTLVKPLLIQNIKKKSIITYCMLKSSLSFFNWVNLLMAVILCIQLLKHGVENITSLLFSLSFFLLLLGNCFLVQLLNHVQKIAFPFLIAFVGILALDFYKYVDITSYTSYFFQWLLQYPYLIISVLCYVAVLIFCCFRYYKNNLSLDSAVVAKKEQYSSREYAFLNRFGSLAPFLKLDIKLLTRNKRTKTVLLMSAAFLLYGMLFFTMDVYKESTFMHIVAAIMITGGFMMLFGQYVPSWDSSYYPLMMTQNVPYRTYLESKWLIMVLATVLATILASFYLFFGTKIYLTIVAVGCYNIGWNCYMSLITGVYVRSKIDLTSNKNAFGDSKAFNIQTLLLSLPTILIPAILYYILNYFFEFYAAIILLIIIGLLGISLKSVVFDRIEKMYKQKKYETLKAYK